ncbi:hypothetical protein ETB97_012028 [Aspergillus alliaceus]|uniref:Beta-lactamase domain-containing protein n=1 Tax=Petromyces alliaceus TaxID=209559 RepID=A0A5N6G9V1_PETAA|nr:beta-lactamase domain-containing protein [Aspergillus alliaceus]KAB8239221.1 beta-lactamase domain-containing protein [Aspergillus alliaceus]KAE8395720.1 beta-lactamase domain-containing protein [Aspergillus alliaceus]KAF5866474.1 hypothetical protein ETB97_012028 [Aspergillus burnettii]
MTVSKDNSDKDFEFAHYGLIRVPQDPFITSSTDSKAVVWNCDAYDFLQEDCADTANPSLWRQGQLCSVTAGLYQVVSGIFQVRGFDLANMSIVQIPNTNGIIIIDCLTSVETAKSALDLYQGYHQDAYGQKADIKALFYTHCHVDHFGGAQAIVDQARPNLPIIGPDGFLEHAVSENVYGGAAMARRSIYMYGEALEKSPTGQIGCGLGQAPSTGTSSLVAPTYNITKDGPLPEHIAIAGLEIICQLTPGTEAPAEVNFFFPSYRALCMAENATHTLHNIQTLRGAPVRDARLWSRYLDKSIALFGHQSDVVFSSHHWPTWNVAYYKPDDPNTEDQKLVVQFLSEQRDYYAYLHNETLRQLNDGKTPVEIAEEILMPPQLQDKTNLRGYYGSINHNVKAVYDKYMGWFDGNPAYLWPLAPVDEAKEFVQCMGGPEKVLQLAQQYRASKNLRFAATLLDKLVFADASNQDAKDELASVYTDLGYGAENGTWRNIYLTGAYELQHGSQRAINAMSQQSLMALNLDELFDTIAIRIIGPEAFKQADEITIDFMVAKMQQGSDPSIGWHLRLSNGALTGHSIPYLVYPNQRNSRVTLTVWLEHQDLVNLVGAAASANTSDITQYKTVGNTQVWQTITSLVKVPNDRFNIVTP